MPKIWKHAIIGCGGIANNKHMPALKTLADCAEIVAFCDIVPERAEKALQDYGAPGAKVYHDYRELLQNKDVEIVHVCTPNRSHSEITVAALDAGKHVICEKPMAINPEEAQRMLDARNRSGKVLTIGYQYRQYDHSLQMKKLAETGALGEIYFAKAHGLRRRMVPNWGVFLNKEEQGGGPLIDCGTHALDLALWMMENYKPKYVLGQSFHKLGRLLEPEEQGNQFGAWDNRNFEVEDSAFGMIKMENGATIWLESSWALNITEAKQGVVTLCGTRGGVTCKQNAAGNGPRFDVELNHVVAGVLSETNLHNGLNLFSKSGNAAGEREAANLMDCLEDKAELLVKPEQAFVVTKILDAIYRSSSAGTAIEL